MSFCIQCPELGLLLENSAKMRILEKILYNEMPGLPKNSYVESAVLKERIWNIATQDLHTDAALQILVLKIKRKSSATLASKKQIIVIL